MPTCYDCSGLLQSLSFIYSRLYSAYFCRFSHPIMFLAIRPALLFPSDPATVVGGREDRAAKAKHSTSHRNLDHYRLSPPVDNGSSIRNIVASARRFHDHFRCWESRTPHTTCLVRTYGVVRLTGIDPAV